MSSLPLISHHLYVAAVCQENRVESASRVQEEPATGEAVNELTAETAEPLVNASLQDSAPIQLAFGIA